MSKTSKRQLYVPDGPRLRMRMWMIRLALQNTDIYAQRMNHVLGDMYSKGDKVMMCLQTNNLMVSAYAELGLPHGS